MQQAQHNAVQNGIDQYQRPRELGETDLITEVRNCLISSGLLQNVITAYDNNRFIMEAKDKTSDVQRFLLNRYWSQQLMLSNSPSIEERYCLIPNGAIADWLSLFKDKILPFVIAHNLPSPISG